MDKEFFERKVKAMSDDELESLLRIRLEANPEIVEIVFEEANRRGLDIPEVLIPTQTGSAEDDEIKKLNKWNWGAFFLAPFWTLANKLESWTIWTFIPGINLGAIIYLGLKGNRLAFEKSQIRNIDQFMTLQAVWNDRAIKIFWTLIGLSIVWVIISVLNS